MSDVRPQFALIVGTNASWRATAGTPTYVEVNGDASHLGSIATKFELVPSTRGPDYFHIKCCLNNKYLRIENRGLSTLIAAEEDEPIDDIQAITLFWNSGGSWNTPGILRKPLGVQTPWLVDVRNDDHRLLARQTAQHFSNAQFKFVPWELPDIRPQFALIVGSNNASWRATTGTPTYVEVNGDASHLGSTATKFELVPSTRGPDYFHIKCCLNNKYLRIENRGLSTLISAEEDEPIDDIQATTLFWNSGGYWIRPGILRKPLGVQTPWLVDVRNDDHRLLARQTAQDFSNAQFKFIPWELFTSHNEEL